MKKRGVERKIAVAGATGAIGSAICRALANQGDEVYGWGKNLLKLLELEHSLNAHGGRFTPIMLDSLGPDGWEKALRATLISAGHLDLFVHAIGVIIPGSVLELTEVEIQQILQVNFVSAVTAARAVLPDMVARGEGQIVIVGSLGGIVPMPFQALYCASKFALRGFCHSLHEEVRQAGVSVSLLSPGPVESRMLFREGSDRRAALTFAGRPVDPEIISRRLLNLTAHPRRELILSGRFLGALANTFPWLFGSLFPALRKLGARRLRHYRDTSKETPDAAASLIPSLADGQPRFC